MRHGSGWEGVDAAWETPTDPRAYDALADLFLGEQAATEAKPNGVHGAGRPQPPAAHDSDAAPMSPSPQASEPLPAAPPIDALILGHVPAMPGAWAVQVARAMSEEDLLPTALVRCADGVASVELIGEDAAGTVPSPTLEEALGAAAARAGRTLVRLEAGAERSISDHPAIAGVVLVTGADEPAVVAAYATLKSFAGAAGGRRLPCTIVFVGVSGAKAREAGDKLCRAAGAFLNLPVSWRLGPERIAPAVCATLFRGPSNVSTRSVVAALHAASLAARTAPLGEAPPAPSGPPAEVVDASAGEAEAIAPVTASPTSHDLESSLVTAPAPADEPPVTFAREILPSIREAPFDCPDAPGVRIGLDARGRLHAVAEGGPEQAAQLLAAQSWAARHSALLTLAFRSLQEAAFDGAAPTLLTLVTTDARACAALLRTPIQVRVRAGEATVAINAGA